MRMQSAAVDIVTQSTQHSNRCDRGRNYFTNPNQLFSWLAIAVIWLRSIRHKHETEEKINFAWKARKGFELLLTGMYRKKRISRPATSSFGSMNLQTSFLLSFVERLFSFLLVLVLPQHNELLCSRTTIITNAGEREKDEKQ